MGIFHTWMVIEERIVLELGSGREGRRGRGEWLELEGRIGSMLGVGWPDGGTEGHRRRGKAREHLDKAAWIKLKDRGIGGEVDGGFGGVVGRVEERLFRWNGCGCVFIRRGGRKLERRGIGGVV